MKVQHYRASDAQTETKKQQQQQRQQQTQQHRNPVQGARCAALRVHNTPVPANSTQGPPAFASVVCTHFNESMHQLINQSIIVIVH
jgi:hypothetical protein